MTNEEERYYKLAEEFADYNGMSVKAMALLANENKKSKTAMRVFSFSWKRNARNMAKAVDLFEKYFIHEGYTAQDYLTLFDIASVSKFERGMLYEDWTRGSLNGHQVRERVLAIKTPKPRVKQERRCPHCGEVLT
jgi:hypothetical protein